MSLQERVSAVKTEAQKKYGAAMCHAYYQQTVAGTTLTSGEVENVFDFLKSSRSIEFNQLNPVKLPMIKL